MHAVHEYACCVQLFKKPHPQKKLSVRGHPSAGTQLGFFVSSAANDRLFFHNVDNLRPSMQPLKGENFYLLCHHFDILLPENSLFVHSGCSCGKDKGKW